MASVPTAANQEPDRSAQAAALALLLAAPNVRYSLPALIRSQNIKPRPFRQIRPTLALKYDLTAPYYAIVRAWAVEESALMSAYATGDVGTIQRAIEQAAARVGVTVSQAQSMFPRIAQTIERWHRAQWIGRTKASIGLDVSMFTQPGDVASDMQATAAWNGQLAADVHRQVQHGVATALLAGAAAALPLSEVRAWVQETVAKAKRRSAGIGGDQVDKLSRAMDRSRREAASVTQFMWLHSPHVVHPRPHHVARNGKIFSEDDIAPDDRAGVPFGCQCSEIPVLQ